MINSVIFPFYVGKNVLTYSENAFTIYNKQKYRLICGRIKKSAAFDNIECVKTGGTQNAVYRG